MPKRKPTPEDEAKISVLRDRLVTTIHFIEEVEDFPSGRDFREVIDDSARKGDLRGLKLLARDVDAMTIALPPNERTRLDTLLRERIGIDKEAETIELRRKMEIVLERGTIASEVERRRVEEYVDMLETTGGDPKKTDAFRKLLSRE